MNKFYNTLTIHIVLIILLLLISSCAPTHYGVAEKEWQKLSEAERVTVIKGYNERQRLRQQQRFEEEKRKRVEAEQRASERKKHVDSIYNGSAGQFGDLLRVSMENGRIKISGKRRSFRPVSFKIADQECKAVSLIHEKKHYSYSGKIVVCYRDGSLLLDAGRSNNHGIAAITYDPAWVKGKIYSNINSNGPGKLDGVSVLIQAVASRGRVIEHVVW